MKIACVGGGPAGLYFAVLTRLRHPEREVTVFERDPEGSTYGWGLGFYDDLVQELAANDPVSAKSMVDAAFKWVDQLLDVGGNKILDTGNSGYSIGRKAMLNVLADRARQLGVDIRYDREISSRAELDGFDLIVASDGVNSRLRNAQPDQFGSEIDVGRNKYLWLGTTKVYSSFFYTFVKTDSGWLCAAGYPIDETLSTFVVECAPETLDSLGLEHMEPAEHIATLERIFAKPLEGHSLMSQMQSQPTIPWLNFRRLTTAHWHNTNMVLAGDSAHTTHYSIGSGTKLAFEDAIALADHLDSDPDIETAFEAYETERKAALVRLQTEALYSATFMEKLDRYINLPLKPFFDLWQVRRSPMLDRIPPMLYYRLHRATTKVPMLAAMRDQIGVRARTSRNRRARGEKATTLSSATAGIAKQSTQR